MATSFDMKVMMRLINKRNEMTSVEQNPELKGLAKACLRTTGRERAHLVLIAADWLDEHNCPLMAEDWRAEAMKTLETNDE